MRNYMVGIDEVGRGPLAGPVAVCAVCVRKRIPNAFFSGLKNSKALSEKARKEWYQRACEAKKKGVLDFAVSFSSALYIDTKGISNAVHHCIARSLRRLEIDPRTKIFLDGSIYAPRRFKNQTTIIRGDELIPIIALASVIAKVCRDKRMRYYAKKFPEYGFETSVGYGTAAHYKAIRCAGLTPLHRKSFLRNVKFSAKDGFALGEKNQS